MAHIKVTKDRHGYIREFAPKKGNIGMLHVGGKGVWLAAPKVTEVSPDETLTKLLVEWVTANPGQSTRAVRKGVPSHAGKTGSLLAELEDAKVLRSEPGPRNAKLWFPGPASY